MTAGRLVGKRARDMLAAIKKVAGEHAYLRGLYAARVEAVKGIDALLMTQSVSPEDVAARLAEGRQKTAELVAFLDWALKSHIEMEEKALAPLLGRTLLRGLHAGHRRAMVVFEKMKTAMMAPWLEAKSASEVALAKATVVRLIDEFSKMIEANATAEDTLMNMARRVLPPVDGGQE